MDWEDYKKSKQRKKFPRWVFGIILLLVTLFGLGYNAYMALTNSLG